jgi:hypothetical protein
MLRPSFQWVLLILCCCRPSYQSLFSTDAANLRARNSKAPEQSTHCNDHDVPSRGVWQYGRWARAVLSRTNQRFDRGQSLIQWVRGDLSSNSWLLTGRNDSTTLRSSTSLFPGRVGGDDIDATEQPTDSILGRFAQSLAWVVGIQSFLTVLTANSSHLIDEVPRFLTTYFDVRTSDDTDPRSDSLAC